MKPATLPRLRLVYAALLLAASSGPLLSSSAQQGTRRFVRILGARQAAEALVGLRWSSRVVIIGSAAVDAIHAVTMVALATTPSHRGPELANAATATAFCGASLLRLRAAHE